MTVWDTSCKPFAASKELPLLSLSYSRQSFSGNALAPNLGVSFVYALITYDFEYVLISLYFLIINIDIALIWIPFIDKKHIKTNQKNTKMAVKEIINSSVLIDFLPNKKYKSANFIHFRNSAKYL